MDSSPSSEEYKSQQGMWIFIGSEVLFFSGLFLSLTLYRCLFPRAFAEGTSHLELWMGAANTFFLLCSSWLVAEFIEEKKAGHNPGHLRLWLTVFLGALFLALKAWEYTNHIHEGLFPGSLWHPLTRTDSHLPLFFFLYFFVTALHALHLLIGICVLIYLLVRSKSKEIHWSLFGLYWHFVDVIWIFVFTIFYLGSSKL